MEPGLNPGPHIWAQIFQSDPTIFSLGNPGFFPLNHITFHLLKNNHLVECSTKMFFVCLFFGTTAF